MNNREPLLISSARITAVALEVPPVIVSPFTKTPLVFVTIVLFIVSIFVHYLFGINTITNQYGTN